MGKLYMRFTIQIAIAKRFLPLYFRPAGKIGAVFLRSLPAILGLAHFVTYDTRAISEGKKPPEAIAFSVVYYSQSNIFLTNKSFPLRTVIKTKETKRKDTDSRFANTGQFSLVASHVEIRRPSLVPDCFGRAISTAISAHLTCIDYVSNEGV